MWSHETEEIKDLCVNLRVINGYSPFSVKVSWSLLEFRIISSEIDSCSTVELQSIKHFIYRLIKETVPAQSSLCDDIRCSSLKSIFSKEDFCQTMYLWYQCLLYPCESRQGNLGHHTPDLLTCETGTSDWRHATVSSLSHFFLAHGSCNHEPKLNPKVHLGNNINLHPKLSPNSWDAGSHFLSKKSILVRLPGFEAGCI